MLMLGAGVRFLHFALFSAHILALESYLVDTLYLVAVASISFRITRTNQMARQYPWLYERTGPFTWRERNRRGRKFSLTARRVMTSRANSERMDS